MKAEADRTGYAGATRKLLAQTLDSVDEAIFVVAYHRKIVQCCNAAVTRLFGYEPEELAGKSTACLHVSRGTFERFGERSEPALQAEGRFETEYPLKRKDGSIFHAHVTVSPLDSKQGWKAGVVSVIRDISEQKQAQENERQALRRLAEAEKFAAIGRVSSGIAHEMNNPLAAIRSSAELIKRALQAEGLDSEEAARRTDKILRNVDRCKSIVENLLGYARHGAGEYRSVHLPSALREALHMVREDAAPGGPRIVCTSRALTFRDLVTWKKLPPDTSALPPVVDDPSAHVRARPGQLEQVFRNLLDNARTAAGPGGLVIVSCRKHGEGFDVAVADTGLGIAEENLPLLFEPFYTTKEPGEGTGLGLYMSRCMVESAGGSLECASRPGVGTMMRVRLGYEDKDHDPDR